MMQRLNPALRAGLTLVELLVAAAISLLILVIVVGQLRTSSQTSIVASQHQSLLEDLRTAGNYIGDMGTLAGYVFPVGAKLTIGAASGYTVRNPDTGNNTWEVGTHPILAMLLPPASAGGTCDIASSSSADKAGCVRFMAFYTLSRTHVSSNATGAENPGADQQNPNALALYRYFQYVSATSVQTYVSNLNTSGTLANATFTGQTGNLLADYIAPEGFDPNFERCFAGGSTLNAFDATPSKCDTVHSASQVRVLLQTQIIAGGRTTVVPSVPLAFSFATRNTVEP